MRAALLTLLGALAAGCATTGAGEVRRIALRFEGAAPTTAWKRVATERFELLTDLPADDARRAAQLLTQSVDGLHAMFGKAPVQVDRKLVVIALADGLEFERRFGRFLWGFAVIESDETTVCLYGPPDRWFVRAANLVEATHSVLQHELAHAVLSRYFVHQPTWFAEGMAQYLETFRWLDERTLLLGEPNLEAWRGYAAVRSIELKDLFSWRSYEQRETETTGYYGLAWALVHWAINREPQRFSAFLSELVEGRRDAFERAFGPLLPELDRAIHQYLKQGQYSKLRLDVPLGAPAPARLEETKAPTELFDRIGKVRKR